MAISLCILPSKWSETARAGQKTARKRGRSASDSPTLELVNKKKKYEIQEISG